MILVLAVVFVFRQTGPKGLMSELNQPWPAKVQTKQPQFPPTLTPAQELKTFHMAPGFQVQLVASEPLVMDPIVAEFDGDGRLWVVEMQGYAVGQKMVNMTEPVGDVAILEDTDGDGIYDKRTVFQDKLVLPRALKILDHGCALIGEPPNLVKACDTNGDLKADTKEVIKDGFGRRRQYRACRQRALLGHGQHHQCLRAQLQCAAQGRRQVRDRAQSGARPVGRDAE